MNCIRCCMSWCFSTEHVEPNAWELSSQGSRNSSRSDSSAGSIPGELDRVRQIVNQHLPREVAAAGSPEVVEPGLGERTPTPVRQIVNQHLPPEVANARSPEFGEPGSGERSPIPSQHREFHGNVFYG